jgi:molecular chaperone IbpA
MWKSGAIAEWDRADDRTAFGPRARVVGSVAQPTYRSVEDMVMNAFDLSPLFRSTVGFDRMAQLLDRARLGDDGTTYPPYNIEKLGPDQYRIQMAVAGLSEADLDIQVQDQVLTVRGRARPAAEAGKLLHRGIAGRAFERRFQLAEHIEVAGAKLEYGLLNIDLKREIPEAMKPRTIPIQTSGAAVIQAAPRAA